MGEDVGLRSGAEKKRSEIICPTHPLLPAQSGSHTGRGRAPNRDDYAVHQPFGIRQSHPSEKVVVKLADALGIDRAQLFLLANPAAEAILTPPDESEHGSAWEEFRKDKRLHRIHKISVEEMALLSEIDMLGAGVRSARDYMFILNTIRHALGR
jgi:hypothetical protein